MTIDNFSMVPYTVF